MKHVNYSCINNYILYYHLILSILNRFADHYKYLDAWIEALELPKKLHFVLHDWGSALGFHWCNLHRHRVKSIAFTEAFTGPMFQTWEDFPESFRQVFQDLKSAKGMYYVFNCRIELITHINMYL